MALLVVDSITMGFLRNASGGTKRKAGG